MKNTLTIIILLSVLMLSNSFAQPKLEIVGGDTYDWGKVEYKTIKDSNMLKAKINLKNAGSETLFITEVKPGCGCTTAPLDKNELKPGETATLDVTLRVNLSSAHDLLKNIRITSNDAKEPNKLLYLKANIFLPIEVTPSYFGFNEMTTGQLSLAVIKIKNNSDKAITLTDLNVAPKDITVEFRDIEKVEPQNPNNNAVKVSGVVNTNLKKKEILKPGESVNVTAKVTPEKSGQYSCNLKIKTSDTDMPEINIGGFGHAK